MTDLNALGDGGLYDFQARRSCLVATHFRNVEDALCSYIETADAVVGCVAWLTSDRVLKTLAKRQAVSIVVQKEDFLRPDINSGHSPDWKRSLRKLYDAIPGNFDRGDFEFRHTGLQDLSYCQDASIGGIRCAGVRKKQGEFAAPRMHHKFMVFLRMGLVKGYACHTPYAVWTGSFNPSKNARASLENGVCIYEPTLLEKNADGELKDDGDSVPMAYLCEWAQVVGYSEPLDWESEYVQPEWSLGS